MLKRRQVLCIEAEAEDTGAYVLPSISEMLGLPKEAPVIGEMNRRG